jgi:hypothetical protein
LLAVGLAFMGVEFGRTEAGERRPEKDGVTLAFAIFHLYQFMELMCREQLLPQPDIFAFAIRHKMP